MVRVKKNFSRLAAGASEDDIKKRVISIVTSLHAQLCTAGIAAENRAKAFRKPLYIETILCPGDKEQRR